MRYTPKAMTRNSGPPTIAPRTKQMTAAATRYTMSSENAIETVLYFQRALKQTSARSWLGRGMESTMKVCCP
jgi:hypothetical protein